jgi:murein DD-endopeptidase MepM/ murein hydrolase activator NlpD
MLMRGVRTILGILAVLLAAEAAAGLAQEPPVEVAAEVPAESSAVEPVLELGRQATARLYAAETAPLWQAMTDPMQAAFGNEAALKEFCAKLPAQFGEETAVTSEAVDEVQGFRVYRRLARFSGTEHTMLVQWAFNQQGRIGGFVVQPVAEPAPSEYEEYQTKVALRLPFEGEWTVVWGGRTAAENYHVVAKDQRYAYDLLVVRDGATHGGDGKALTDYYCWGREILSPAAGVVSSAVDGLPDQVPGEMDPAHAAGNHVVIDHGEGEYSLLAHLQQGSLRVKEGDAVEAGQVVGLCGNSGNTSEPHLHYHLQTEGRFGSGVGLPAQFQGYSADGQPVERGEPRRGQVIAPGSGEEPAAPEAGREVGDRPDGSAP